MIKNYGRPRQPQAQIFGDTLEPENRFNRKIEFQPNPYIFTNVLQR
jgi:hypothetical protein